MNHELDVQAAGIVLFFIGCICGGIGAGMALEGEARNTRLAGKALLIAGIFLISMPMLRLVTFFIAG